MKIVFIPQFFYMSLVFIVILSIFLYFEKDNIKTIKDIDGDTKNKYIKFATYLFLIGYFIFIFSFRIWIFDMYYWMGLLQILRISR